VDAVNSSGGGNSAPRTGAISQLGRYKLIQLLGIGGMAEVFKARCASPGGFDRTVVVKRILPVHSRDPEFVRMFVAEAQLLGLLHHPNVVQAYDLGEFDGTLFMVMEYVDGPSLSRVMSTLRAAGGQMPFAMAAYFALEVCRALDHVHNLKGSDGEALNVIHRDVTPSNILLTQAGGIKLLDFGVAKYRASQALSVEGTVKGKPAYLAPEALEAQAIDKRVDIFSLGIVLHEILTLQSLFESDSQVLTFRKILDLPIAPPSRARPEVPPELDAIVMKALERDLGRRYQTAGEMAADLDGFVAAQRLRMDQVCAFVQEVRTKTAPNRFTPDPQAAKNRAVSEKSTNRLKNPMSWGARLRRFFTRDNLRA
jgi:serine/threonine protein kinase